MIVHPSTFIYWLYAFVVGHGLFMALASASIIVHEIAHAAVAMAFGYAPTNLELTPMGAIMRLDEEEKIPHVKHFLILLAGPAATILLSLAALYLTKFGLISLQAGRLMFSSNLAILLINVLPAPPLDGGRILSLILGILFPRGFVNRIMRVIGIFEGIALICLNVYVSWHWGGWNLSLAFAGCCILYSSNVYTTTRAFAELRSFIDRKIMIERRGYLEIRQICALGNTPIRQLIRLLPPMRMATFICLEEGSMRRLGELAESELIHIYLSAPELTLKRAVLMSENDLEYAKYDTK